MRFTVIWTELARQQLADIWVRSSDRNEVAGASHRIDQELAADPDLKGIDFYGDRLLTEPPLAAVYRVIEPDRQVWVLQVGRSP